MSFEEKYFSCWARVKREKQNKNLKFLISFLRITTCFLCVFQQTKRLKNLQMFLAQIKNIFIEKKHFFFSFFVSASVFPLLQDIWFKHMAKRIEFTKTNKKCTQKICSLKKKLLWRVGKMANIKNENSKTWQKKRLIR